MCTISWFSEAQGYHVFFNRDEQRNRPKANPPSNIRVNSITALMPIDPVGKGSWLAVNEHGLTCALLNYYQGRFPKGRLKSRGQIVKSCAGLKSLQEIRNYLSTLDLHHYPPFTLLVFNLNDPPIGLCWDGKHFSDTSVSSPFFSSAVEFEKVVTVRQQTYKNLFSEQQRTAELHRQFHSGHLPEKSAYSVCMHREDAQTVSFSHIDVNQNGIRFHYVDGPPCESEEIYVSNLEIPRSNAAQ